MGLARHTVADQLTAVGVARRACDDALLVLSELVSNAVKHAAPLPNGGSPSAGPSWTTPCTSRSPTAARSPDRRPASPPLFSAGRPRAGHRPHDLPGLGRHRGRAIGHRLGRRPHVRAAPWPRTPEPDTAATSLRGPSPAASGAAPSWARRPPSRRAPSATAPTASARGHPRRGRPRAVPVRVRAAATRPATAGPPATPPSLRRPAVRGAGRRVRLGRAARDRPGRDRRADPGRRSTPASQATLATVLPLAWPGLVRQDGEVFVGLQVPGGSGDASRDVARRPGAGARAEPGTPIAPTALPGPGPRLQDLLDPAAPLDVTGARRASTSGSTGVEDRSPEVVGLDGAGQRGRRARPCGSPRSRRRTGARSGTATTCAGSCRTTRTRCSTRWPGCTPPAPTGSARARATSGSFRAHGLLVPVWDLAAGHRGRGTGGARSTRSPVRLAEALADSDAAGRGGAPGPGRAAQPPAHPALTDVTGEQSVPCDAGRTVRVAAARVALGYRCRQARALLHPPSVALGPFHVRSSARRSDDEIRRVRPLLTARVRAAAARG